MITTLCFFASLVNASVLGPGIVSASLKKRWSSTWQKYCEVNSSCVQRICPPCFAACSSRRSCLARLVAGSGAQLICVRPTLTTWPLPTERGSLMRVCLICFAIGGFYGRKDRRDRKDDKEDFRATISRFHGL